MKMKKNKQAKKQKKKKSRKHVISFYNIQRALLKFCQI